MKLTEDILKRNPLLKKIKDSIDNKKDLLLEYEELVEIYSSCVIGEASDIILTEILAERYK